MSDCIDTNTPEWRELLTIVKGNTEDAVEVWESLKGRTPETDYEKEYVRKFYSMARSLRKKTDDQLADFLKGVTPEFDYWNGRLMLQKHHEIEARNFIADINRRVRYERVTVQETKKFRKGGNKAYYAKINGRGYFDKKIKYQKTTPPSSEEFVASEKTIRDLAARMSDRIGIPIKFESDRTKDYKGKIEGNVAYINLAHATLDTPIHEILAHPIIRAIKNRTPKDFYTWLAEKEPELAGDLPFLSEEEFDSLSKDKKESYKKEYDKLKNESKVLYQSLLKELETGKGKEVFEQVKRDYVYKESLQNEKKLDHLWEENGKYYFFDEYAGQFGEDGKIEITKEKYEELTQPRKYTLEEQQEEAIVELLGLMTADRLDKVKDGKLISLLKRLLKEMKAFMRSLIGQKEVEIDKLPDNMTLGDLADLLAYSNSKLILPGNEVIYTTPDNKTFKTYAEASKHVSELSKINETVDIDNIDITPKELPKNFKFNGKVVNSISYLPGDDGGFLADENMWEPPAPAMGIIIYEDGTRENFYEENIPSFILEYTNVKNLELKTFIEKNKEYEQSKEIIEEWKKVNNIQYNPEEIYSRGQEFVSVVGAYSDFDVDLMMQNLLQHIEDNEKAGGKFAISAYTKPIDKKIGHLEGGGGKIKFKIYPQSQDILWAANTDVYSGSVWDASEKVNKDKKSELLGVSYTKYPSLGSINSVQPNLAAIVDDLSHHHNELGIVLTGNNFRLEYDENVPYSTKKIINSINSILDQKYGKLVKPEINKNKISSEIFDEISRLEALKKEDWAAPDHIDLFTKKDKERLDYLKSLTKSGIQPTQTNETLKESIRNVENRATTEIKEITKEEFDKAIKNGNQIRYSDMSPAYKVGDDIYEFNANFDNKYTVTKKLNKNKEYTSKALINTKISALKEVAKKYPRSLIRSEVRKINDQKVLEELFGFDELPFQKISQEYIPPDPKIEARLKAIMADLGIRLESYDEYAEWYEETYHKPLNAVAVADLFNKVIAVKEGKADKYTLAEELSHFIAFAIKDSKQMQEILDNIENTEEWKQYSEAYLEDYGGDVEMVKLEIAGKLLAKHLGNTILNERPIWKQRLERLWKAFLKFFTFGNVAKENRIKDNLDSIVNDVLNGNLSEVKKGLEGSKGVFKQIDPEMFKNSKILDTMKDRLEEQIEIIGNKIEEASIQGVESFTDREKILLGKLLENRGKKQFTQGVVNFIAHVEELADNILNKVGKMDLAFQEGIYDEELDTYLKILRDMNGFITIYDKNVRKMLKKVAILQRELTEGSEEAQQIKELMKALQNIATGISTMQETVEENQKELLVKQFSELVYRDYKNNPEAADAKLLEIRQLMDYTGRDVGLARRWADSAAESKDDIIGISDRMYQDHMYDADIRSEDLKKDHINNYIASKEAGMKDETFLYELNENGIPTGYQLDEINRGLYDKKEKEFLTSLRTEFKLTQDPEIENIELKIKQLETLLVEIEDGSKKPFVMSESNVDVASASQFFGKDVVLKEGNQVGDKQKTLQYIKNRIKYLKKKGVRSYSKTYASIQRNLELKDLHPAELAKYKQRLSDWFSENKEENPEWKEMLKEKEISVYKGILGFKKDIDTVQQYKKKHGENWLKQLLEDSPELGNQAKRAEEILQLWLNERKSTDFEGNVSFKREFSRPKLSKYYNPKFKEVMNDPVKKKHYEYFMKSLADVMAHMPPEYKYGKLMPQIRKDDFERFKDDPLRSIPEAVKDSLKLREDETERGNLQLDAQGRKIRNVPIFFMNKLEDPKELSLDATASLIAFTSMALRHKALTNIVDIAEITADILRTRSVVKTNIIGRNEQITTGGNAAQMYEDLMKMRFYGEGQEDEGSFAGIDIAKAADFLNRYSALNGLALNIYAGFQNVLLGNIIIRQETFANEFFDKKDILYADKKYFSITEGVRTVLDDMGQLRSKSKLRLFTELFNVLQDFEGRTRETNTDRSRWGRMFNLSALFFVNHAGEHQMLTRTALAMAHKLKVLNKEGKEIPLYEALVVDNYKLKIAEGTKNLDGSDFTLKDIRNISIKMAHVNQRMHGIYNKIDKSPMQRYAIGRLIIMFRKFLKPALNRRFEGEYHNWVLESDIEGFYRTAFNFFKTLSEELKDGQLTLASAKDNYNNLPEHKKANLRRALGEVVILLGGIFTAYALEALAEGIDDDDEMAKWGVNMAVYQANRLVTETGFYVPVLGTREALRILKTPAAAVNQIDKILQLGKVIDPFAFGNEDADFFPSYKSGRHRDELKLKVYATDIIPLASTVEDWFYPEDRLKFFTQ